MRALALIAVAAAALILAASATTKPPHYPKVPKPPAGPDVTTPAMPEATALPAHAATIKIRGVSRNNVDLALAVTPNGVWTASGAYRINPADNSVSGPFARGTEQDIGVGAGSVWVSDYNAMAAIRLDPKTGKRLASVQLNRFAAPEGVVAAGGAIWVAAHHGGNVIRIDPRTNRIAATIQIQVPKSGGPQEVAAGFGSVWVAVPNEQAVFRIDPRTNKVVGIVVLPRSIEPCGGIAVGKRDLWVTGCSEGTKIAHIDPHRNFVKSILEVGGEVFQPAVDGNTIWFVAGGDPDYGPKMPAYLIQLRADDTVATRIQLPTGFISGGTAVAAGSIWVADFSHPRVIRIPKPS
jgi:streptogramin lyase